MRAKSPSGCQVVKKDQKCAVLRAFVLRSLESRRLSGADCSSICLVARSLESPAARVLASLADEIAALRINVRAVITAIDSNEFGGDSTVKLCPPFTAESTRVVHDARLYDAHEQLILDDATTWVGDCMRREPSKTDAFERFAENCAVSTKWSQQAFNSLWRAGQPAKFDATPNVGIAAMTDALKAIAVPGQSVKEVLLNSATRH